MVPLQCGGWVFVWKELVNSTPTPTPAPAITPIYYTRTALLSGANYTTTLLLPRLSVLAESVPFVPAFSVRKLYIES